jgi:hypothetical protein
MVQGVGCGVTDHERYSGKGAFQNAVFLIAPFNASAPLAKSQVCKWRLDLPLLLRFCLLIRECPPP